MREAILFMAVAVLGLLSGPNTVLAAGEGVSPLTFYDNTSFEQVVVTCPTDVDGRFIFYSESGQPVADSIGDPMYGTNNSRPCNQPTFYLDSEVDYNSDWIYYWPWFSLPSAPTTGYFVFTDTAIGDCEGLDLEDCRLAPEYLSEFQWTWILPPAVGWTALAVPDLTPLINSSTTQGLNGFSWTTGVIVLIVGVAILLGIYYLIKRKLIGVSKGVLGTTVFRPRSMYRVRRFRRNFRA